MNFIGIYWNKNDIETLKGNIAGRWAAAFYENTDNFIPAFQSDFIKVNITSITAVYLEKINGIDLQNCTVNVLESSLLSEPFLEIEKLTKNGSTYSAISNPKKFITSEILSNQGIFQLRIVLNTGDVLFSDIFCMPGLPVPVFACSDVNVLELYETETIILTYFYIRITRTDTNTSSGIGKLYVKISNNQAPFQSYIEVIDFQLPVGGSQLFSRYIPYENYTIDWYGACTDSITLLTCDSDIITADNTLITADKTFE